MPKNSYIVLAFIKANFRLFSFSELVVKLAVGQGRFRVHIYTVHQDTSEIRNLSRRVSFQPGTAYGFLRSLLNTCSQAPVHHLIKFQYLSSAGSLCAPNSASSRWRWWLKWYQAARCCIPSATYCETSKQ